MKNLKLVTSALVCIFLFSISSCEKDKDNKDTLPPETHEGLNKFGCLVNQELFRESGSLSFGLSNPSAEIRDNVLSIATSHAVTDGQKIISFGIKNFNGTGIYYTGAGYTYRKSDISAIDCNYIGDTVDTKQGFVNITYYDPTKKIVSGTFSFVVKLFNPYPTPSTCDSAAIHITEGRFDLTFYKWN